MWIIRLASNNACRRQMGFNLMFKGLSHVQSTKPPPQKKTKCNFNFKKRVTQTYGHAAAAAAANG